MDNCNKDLQKGCLWHPHKIKIVILSDVTFCIWLPKFANWLDTVNLADLVTFVA